MTDGHANSETQQECSGNSAQPDVTIPHRSSDLRMFETMARLHLQNDPLAPWGSEVEPHLLRDTQLWKTLNVSPIPRRQAAHGAKRVWRIVLWAVAVVGLGVSALAVRQRANASAKIGAVEHIIGATAPVAAEDTLDGLEVAAPSETAASP